MDYLYYKSRYLAHHGIKGQKWGIRRYQYADGTLTPDGLKRYGRQAEYSHDYAGSLNKIDQHLTRTAQYAGRHGAKAAEASSHIKDNPKTIFGKMSNAYYTHKMNKEEKKRAEWADAYNNGIKVTNAIVDLAHEKGYEITSVATERLIEKGENYTSKYMAGALLGGPFGAVGVSILRAALDQDVRSGHHYTQTRGKDNHPTYVHHV